MAFPAIFGSSYFTSPRRLAILEPAAVFALIMLYIWWLRSITPSAWAPILGLIVLSHRFHGEEPRTLGFRRANFLSCAEHIAPAVLLVALALLSAGTLLATNRPIGFDQGFLALAGYCPWGLFQQYLLNGYFVNRLAIAAPPRYVPALAGTVFALVHLPNWFLMTVSFVAGYLCASIYLKYRNLYVLGLAHGAVGFLLFLVVPDAISRHLTVGPGWFTH